MFSAQSFALALAIAGVANAATVHHGSRASTHRHAARTLPSGWAKVDCYTDAAANRVLVGYYHSDSSMTTTTCLNKCSSMGYEYAGLEFGQECFCSHTLQARNGAGVVRPAAECNMPCAGYKAGTCGAGNRLSIYKHSGGASSSSSSSSSTPVATGTSKKIKIGLAWANDKPDAIKHYKGSRVEGVYSWNPSPISQIAANGFDFYPMIWGAKQEATFKSKVPPGSKYHTILGFNEPNEKGQSNMSPEAACTLWRRTLTPMKNAGHRVVSPATTCGPDGLAWMQKFVKVCPDAKFDVIALHWYNIGMTDFKARLNAYHKAFPNYPIWVTEYAQQNWNGGKQTTLEQNKQFLKDSIAWMDSQWFIEKAFPYGFMTNMNGLNKYDILMKGDGTPSELGYVALNA